MQVVVDIDLHIVTGGIGSRVPTNAIGLKSQDTPALDIYFVSGGVVQDLGESAAVKFGLVVGSAPTTFLSFDSTFTRETDANGLVYYQGFPVFNTTEMGTALGSAISVTCVGEIRFALSDGEIVHVLDIPFIVYRTILVEGGTPATTVIAVYPDPSVLEVKTNKNIDSGYAGLDSSGLLSSAVIPATVELIARKNAASGYAGLSSGSLLTASQIPVDGVTTIIAAGKLAALGPALGVVSVTTDPFTVPAVLATVDISLPVANLTLGLYYVIGNGAGTYQYTAPIDDLHGTFTNVGGTANAVPTTVIAYNANVQWSGPPGLAGAGGGISGVVLTAFTLPTSGGTVLINVDNAQGFSLNALVAIRVPSNTIDFGPWFISAIDDSTHFTIQNDPRWPTNGAGDTIPVGALVVLIDYHPINPHHDTLSGFIEAPTAKTYTIVLNAFVLTGVQQIAIKTLSGTCTASLNHNGTPISGLSAIAVTSTIQTLSAGNEWLAIGDKLDLVISSPSSPVDLAYSIDINFPPSF